MVDGYFDRKVTTKGVNKGAGRPITYGKAIDDQLLCWVLESRDRQLPITIPVLKAKAFNLVSLEYPDFKASDGWARKFMKCHSLVLRAKTQELPTTLEECIRAFHKQIQRVKEINTFKVVGNMDETPYCTLLWYLEESSIARESVVLLFVQQEVKSVI